MVDRRRPGAVRARLDVDAAGRAGPRGAAATQGTTAAQIGLGWLLGPGKDVTGHSGGGPSAAASLIVAPSDGRVSVLLASRLAPIEPVNVGLLRSIG